MSLPEIAEILRSPPAPHASGRVIGRSREGRPIRGFRFGSGEPVSLVAGCHADEPVGPRLLDRLCGLLATLARDHPAMRRWEWWVLPHLNPDGARRNRSWQRAGERGFDLPAYLCGAVRELPGDDIEFGFPRDAEDEAARPENRAAYGWWRTARRPFALHASLHGMAFGAGPWFLVERAWRDRLRPLRRSCAARVRQLGYRLHDVERRGEKGFERVAPGFATRPDSEAMRRYFLELDDAATAALFRPSSMETIRSLGGDPLTLVLEMPLFLTPGVGEELGPPDPVAQAWRDRIESWRERLRETGCEGRGFHAVGGEVRERARSLGLRPMPVQDQMDLQWTLVRVGLELVASA